MKKFILLSLIAISAHAEIDPCTQAVLKTEIKELKKSEQMCDWAYPDVDAILNKVLNLSARQANLEKNSPLAAYSEGLYACEKSCIYIPQNGSGQIANTSLNCNGFKVSGTCGDEIEYKCTTPYRDYGVFFDTDWEERFTMTIDLKTLSVKNKIVNTGRRLFDDNRTIEFAESCRKISKKEIRENIRTAMKSLVNENFFSNLARYGDSNRCNPKKIQDKQTREFYRVVNHDLSKSSFEVQGEKAGKTETLSYQQMSERFIFFLNDEFER